MWVRDRLDGLWQDEDFAGWYSRDGRPGLSPAQLATVSVLQFVLNLSDRQAAEAVRCRIDFKYALGLELDDPGFHHSVLTDFRDRLAEDGRAGRLLDFALERMRQAGLVTGHGKARTDSTYVLAAVRDLTRLELITEAVRAALEELAREDPGVLDELIDKDWATRYGRPVRLGGQPSRPATRLRQAGQDTYLLLSMLERNQRQGGASSDGLRRIFLQNFLVADGKARPRTEEDGLPPASLRIISPYDLQARFGMRGDTRWAGYLIHVTETCDEDTVNLVTDVATTASTATDHEALASIHARLARRALLPAEHLADGGYITLGHLHAAASQQVTMIGPLRHDSSWQARGKAGFALADFAINFDKRQVTCPAGKTSGNWLDTEPAGRAPIVIVKSGKRLCDPCPSRASCTRSSEGRTVNFPPRHLHELRASNHAQQADPDWLRAYGARSGVEGTIAELANGHRARHCRYHGHAKTHTQHILTAIAVNIERLHAHESPGQRERQPTALQKYIIGRELPIPHWWAKGSRS
jgi:transposase